MRFLTVFFSFAVFSPYVFAQPVDIPFEKFRLQNGLTVIVHEDHKAPVVADQHLVPRRFQERSGRQNRFRPLIRAPDVRRKRATSKAGSWTTSNNSARQT